ncbi:MAG: TrbC/VirB2 family protein [Patescibacteria group bacterium]|nr:TrbC/VirB2 family protein [Patescibacteria group bacterium]
MNKKLVKNAVAFLMLLAIFAPGFVLAQGANTYLPAPGSLNLPQGQTTDPVKLVTNIINILLGLLGLLAVIIVLIGGFKWMTAAGSEDRVEKAKKTIQYGAIGLAIILLAYVIVRVVINAIWNVGERNTIQ